LHVRGYESNDGGAYINLLKPFEFSIHNLTDKIKEVGIDFKLIDGAKSFEEIYDITIKNIELLLKERARVTRLGGNICDKVDPLPIFSSSINDCIKEGKDYTQGGAKYNDDHYLCFGLPNIVDSLLAIKELCFDQKVYSLEEFLTAVRNNWENAEVMRNRAISCSGWGDGKEQSINLAKRLNEDLFKIADTLIATRGCKVRIGHLTYTEVRWWGMRTLATPDGRTSGEYFAQGLTPSRLKKIPNVTDTINSLAGLDASLMAGNSVVNVMLSNSNITLDRLEGFMRAVAHSAIQSLQLNCVTKEQLLDAQIHPENHRDLIVRVTGFSALFTSLSPAWQDEFLTRNFYD
jgi:formate C-acetyltransferase